MGHDNPTLSIVMPAYNEEATLARIIADVVLVPHLHELIVVDDCSTDRTEAIVRELMSVNPMIKYLRHDKNLGKTEALKTGFAITTGDIVIIQDADLEYDPAEIIDVIDPILKNRADVVYGSRFMVKRAARVLYFSHYLANKALTFLSNLLTNLNMSDIETCYKAFRGDIIRNLNIVSRGFGFEVEVTAKVAKLKCAVYEVPISYYGRTYEEGKKIGFWDGVAAFWYTFRFNLLTSVRASYKSMPVVLRRSHDRLLTENDG